MPLLHPPAEARSRASAGTPKTLTEQLSQRADAQSLSVYFGQMRALLNAGVGLMVALDEMGRSAPNSALRLASLQMKEGIRHGAPWSETMRAQSPLFSEMTVALIAAGERSGSLVEICAQLSAFAEEEYQVRQMYKRETWYPKVLLFFSTVVVPLPLAIVFFGTPLEIGPGEQAFFVGGIWGAWYVANWFWPVASRGKPRLVMDRWKLKLPVVRDVARGFAVAKVWRVLATLYGAGVSLPTALRIAADACGNAALGESVRAVAPRLERGDTLNATLSSTGEFNEAALGIVRAGEQSGNLDSSLAHAVIFLEMDAKTKLLESTKTIAFLLYLLIAFKIALQVIYFWTGAKLHIG